MKHLNTPTLPAPIARYFESANRFDAPGATECFTTDAIVCDEHKEHVGRAAIEQWIAETSAAFRPYVTVVNSVASGERVNIVGTVAGNFPGSPANLDYEFCLRDGKITRLSIG